MKLKAPYWITAGILTAAGLMTMTGAAVYQVSHLDVDRVSFTEEFSGIENLDVEIGVAECFIKSDADAKVCTVDCVNVPDSMKVYVEDDTLVIEDKREFNIISFGDFSNIGARETSVTIILPEAEYKKLEIGVGVCGETEITDIRCNTLELDVGVGKARLEGVSIDKELNADIGTGDMELTASEIGGSSDIDLGVGNLRMEECTLKKQSDFDLGTGDCIVQNCAFDGLEMDCGVGDVEITGAQLHDKTDIQTGTGDITVEIKDDPSEYYVSPSSGTGDAVMYGRDGLRWSADDAKHQVYLEAGVGDVEVSFAD